MTLPKNVTANGITKTLPEWAKETGIAKGTINDRLRSGWSPEKALSVIPDSNANQPKSAGRQLKEGIITSYLKVWDECGQEEFERQLVVAFKSNALQVIKDFQSYLPKEMIERESRNVEKAVVRIEFNDKPNAVILEAHD